MNILIHSIAFVVLLIIVRALCMMAGTFAVSSLAVLDSDTRLGLSMSMLAKSCVSLDFAAEVAVKYPEWGSQFQTTMISVVLINQFAGPVLCKYALKAFGEAGKMVDGEEEEHDHDGNVIVHKLKRAIICGVDVGSLNVAARLLKIGGWRVTLLDQSRSNLLMAKRLGVAKKDTVSTSIALASETVASPSGSPESVNDEGAALVADSTSEDGSATIDMTDLYTSVSAGVGVGGIGPAPTAAAEPLLDLILVGRTTLSLSAAFGAALDLASIDCAHAQIAIVGLSNDARTYELGVYMMRARGVSRVLVQARNTAWVQAYTDAGLLPVTEQSSFAATIAASAISKGNLSVVNPTLSLVEGLQSILSGGTDESAFVTLNMSADDRMQWDETHAPPSDEAMADIHAALASSGVDAASISTSSSS